MDMDDRSPELDRLRADPHDIARHVSEQRVRVLWTALGVGAFAAAVLLVEYRASISILAAAIPLAILGGDLRRLRAAMREGFVELTWSRHGIVVETGEARTEVPLTEVSARVTPRLLVLVRPLPQRYRFREWTIPGEAETLRAAAESLLALGVPTTFEGGVAATAALLVGGVAFWLVAKVVATAMVVVGLANLGLRLFDEGGSLLTGVLLIVGAIVPMTILHLVRSYLCAKAGRRS